ncbi:hypothetical protein PP175_13000 [Aneurinibacillus sp. Ricciae_BoGa-3]|uniref:hypothetical protein n=1 Tax=Aneurinibacillus sp. Ricciae_BoGa-3 TaxID=3022697 RepID=UPI00234248DB|nr:hypothetical protein [Aneurinibacillus sp. Ricciae_BoGa-3]WCK52375.1 hypothetical protein PP175_13000 [Aneurinibacillus sp. Ricciae_BoGa-3]
MSQTAEHCMECNALIKQPVYAIYQGEEVAGHLCDKCWSRHRMKPLRERSPFEKLAKLKEQLEE